jgi:hypothetical protein
LVLVPTEVVGPGRSIRQARPLRHTTRPRACLRLHRDVPSTPRLDPSLQLNAGPPLLSPADRPPPSPHHIAASPLLRGHGQLTCTMGHIPQPHTANPGRNLAGHVGILPESTSPRPLRRRSPGGYFPPPEPPSRAYKGPCAASLEPRTAQPNLPASPSQQTPPPQPPLPAAARRRGAVYTGRPRPR